MKFDAIRLAAASLAITLSGAASAVTITNGFTYAVASSGGTVGTHFHSNTGGSYGNPAGKAEVGRYSTEEVRGLSEYNLTGLTTASTAFVTFNVFKAGGLFAGVNDFPFSGSITVEAYVGNNLEDVSDWQAPSIGKVGSFSTTPLFVGGVISFDITSIFNSALAAGDSSLGIRLRADPLNATGAWTFDSFRLTADNQSTVVIPSAVPEPGTYALMFAGLGVLGVMAKRRKA